MNATRGLVADVVRSSLVDGPGNRYVMFVQGCTFNCITCHNPHTIPRALTVNSGATWREVDELVEDIASVAGFLSGVTLSGGEATTQWQFVRDLFEALTADPRTAGLHRLVDTNGDAESLVWRDLAPWMHGAAVDLKAFDPEVHQRLTGRDNARVLTSITELNRLDRLAEVRLLIVPGVNDSRDQIEATAGWLAGLSPVPIVVVLGFRHEGTRPIARQLRRAEPSDLDAVVDTLAEHGVAARARRPVQLAVP